MFHSNRCVLPLLASLLFAVGCGRVPIPEYSKSEDLEKAPTPHQEQITTLLENVFGTPTSPHRRVLWEAESEASDDTESEATSEDSDAAEPKPPFDAIELKGEEESYFLVDPDEKQHPEWDPAHLKYGAEVYRVRCAGCHGITGDGKGPAGEYLQPKPRDYRLGIFKFTSTPYGQKPARHDLVRTIRRGAKGTSMPAFRWMSDEDMDAVIDYIILLSQRGEVERFLVMYAQDYGEDETLDPYDLVDSMESVYGSWEEAEAQVTLPATAEPLYDDDTITEGRRVFLTAGCSKCHGVNGEGQTEWLSHRFLSAQEALPEAERIKINYDAWGEPAPAADITARMLHGGRRSIDIYRRIATGINGTPMPAFDQTFAEEPEKIWYLVHYVRSIVEGREVEFPEELQPGGAVTEAAAAAASEGP